MFKAVDSHPNFSKLEDEILKFWEDNKIFEKSLEQTKNGEPFTFYDGPPFATGLPHYGHILASTIKDVIPRYQTMKGRYVRRRWGWDCHGLPIEEIVERLLKISGKKQIEEIGIQKFNETCRSKVLEYVAEWQKTVRRIARWVEFDNSYKTMDREYMESVWWAFKQIYDKRLVYEGRKVLLYCPRCETPVSNFEVAMDNSYQDVTEEAVTVKFKIKDPKFPNTYFLAWTTTPWTLMGNVALAVGKDIEYVKVGKGGEYYIVAEQTRNLSPTLSEIGEGKGEVVSKFQGQDLTSLEYEPLFDIPGMKSSKSYRVYAADFVNIEEGTGIVHTAVVYGEEDYDLGVKEGLPVVPLLDEKGKFNEQAPELVRGQYFKDAEAVIKENLDNRSLLFERKMHKHSYPHCWRCESALYYNAIPAWFINIQKIKKKLLSSNKREISWHPEHLKLGRYAKSVEAAPDWNISRNRYWGNPIPVWKCQSCQNNIVIGSIKELLEKAPNSKFQIPNSKIDLHRPYIDEVIVKCDKCGGEAKRIAEIFDSWVEAGSMPFAEYHYPFENKKVFEARFPAQFVAEYIAQTRAWFYVMHVISEVLFEHAPFENVVTTGTILAEDGSKMSKSKGNFPDPWTVIEKYGVDSLRFYLMNSVVMQADNLNFSERDLINVHRKVTLILWNVYNYFVTYANEAGWQYDSKTKTKGTPTNKLDQWVRARLMWLTGVVSKKLDEYDTVRATTEIERFVNDLSTWYLRRSRGRKDDDFFSTLHHMLVELGKIIAPIMPYISELIYRNLTGEESVHLVDWPETKKLNEKEIELLERMDALRKEVEEVHALRAKEGIKLRQPLALVGSVIGIRDDSLLEIYKSEVNVKEVKFSDKLVIDPVITPELKIEGLARELERQINQFRKESGLKIGGQADLYYETDSANIKKAMAKVDRNKVYLRNIEYGISNMEGNSKNKQIEIDGDELLIALKS
ncbi:MAG: isoleucine--tRNA ligase [Candidatus Doudnabacteria bacterium]|nr:isoleucine--tRNA ligase [bacterium]MDZ4243676.1 isoleucine--tRNA ligase [Candidatus Doudnabacteria bacterium]